MHFQQVGSCGWFLEPIEADAEWSQHLEHRLVDRAAIFADILARNALRRGAQLPQLDVRATFEHEVEQALWREHVEQHHAEVRAQVLDDLRKRLGREPLSAGGRWAINALTQKALVKRYRAQRPT